VPPGLRKPRKLSNHQLLIMAFLNEPSKCNWPNEMRVASKLIKQYDFDFLMSLKGRTKLISLTWFLGDNGKKFLNDIRKYQSLSFEKQKIELEDKPVAPPTKVVKKPKSLKEFLNLFNK